jgi:hypothetical protein
MKIITESNLKKIILTEKIRVGRLMFEAGDTIYVPTKDKVIEKSKRFVEENDLIPYVQNGAITRRQLKNLTPTGLEFFDIFIEEIESGKYDIDEEEKKEMVKGFIEGLETTGMVPMAFFGIVEERNGDMSPLVISQLAPEQEQMLIQYVKPPIMLSNNQSPVIYQPKGTDLMVLEKELMKPVEVEEEPSFSDGLVDDLFTIIMNMTGDQEYSENIANKVQDSLNQVKRPAGIGVNERVPHPEIEAQLRRTSGRPLELSNNAIENLFNTIPQNKLKPEYAEIARKIKSEVPKQKVLGNGLSDVFAPQEGQFRGKSVQDFDKDDIVDYNESTKNKNNKPRFK